MRFFRAQVIAVLFFATILLPGMAAGQSVMSVQVKQGYIRRVPSFLGKIVAIRTYADRVMVVEQKNGWSRILSSPPVSGGWIHTSALTPKKIVLSAGQDDVTHAASRDELALAGKGFNRQVESEFKSQNPDFDYMWIDRMEQFVVSQTQIERFVADGGLTPEGGRQ